MISRAIIPNSISISRVFFGILFYTLITHIPLVPIGALIILFALIEASDLLDGIAARAFKLTSDTGKLLDPICDITAHFLCLFSLYMLFMVPSVIVVIFILREIWVIFLRVILVRHNIVFAARWSGKLKTWFYAIAIFLSILMLPQSPVIVILPKISNYILEYLPFMYFLATALSILSGLHYLFATVKILKTSAPSSSNTDETITHDI